MHGAQRPAGSESQCGSDDGPVELHPIPGGLRSSNSSVLIAGLTDRTRGLTSAANQHTCRSGTCRPWTLGQRPMGGAGMSLRLAAYAVCIEDGRVLLARHVPPKGETNWTLPGGRVEHAEDPFDAVIREVAEETGCVRDRGGRTTSRRSGSAGRRSGTPPLRSRRSRPGPTASSRPPSVRSPGYPPCPLHSRPSAMAAALGALWTW